MLGQLADLIGNHGKSASCLTGARSFDRGVKRQQVGLLGNIVNHVDDLRNFEGPVTQRLDALGRRLHGRAYALHAFQRVAHGAVALLGGVECAACSLSAGFSVVGNLLHRNRKLFHGGRRVGDLLVLLDGARGHLFRRDQDLVGARLHVNGGLAHALQHLGKVIEHVIDRVHHVTQRVIAHSAAQRQVAAGNLAHDGQELRHALLQVFLRLLVKDGAGRAFSGAVQVLGNETEVVSRVNGRTGAIVALREPLSKLREALHRVKDTVGKREDGQNHRPYGTYHGDHQLHT